MHMHEKYIFRLFAFLVICGHVIVKRSMEITHHYSQTLQ